MNRLRTSSLAVAIAATAVLLAACGSSSESSSSQAASSANAASSDAASDGSSAASSPDDTAGATAAAGEISCVDGAIQASGSSAQANAITDWVNAYQTACPGATIDYQPVGSGAGVQAFISGQISFAGTDSAVSGDDLSKASAICENGGAGINIPMVGGAIAVAYNLEGVDGLVLNSDTVAGIFANKITKWNDPAIAATNPGAALPDATIAQFHRSDSSGTTDNFTSYLTATAPDTWTFGSGKDWTAPGGQGSKGSDQVIASVNQTPNSIGYVELSYVLDASGAKAASIDNGGGAVEATSETAAKTIAAAEITGTGDDLTLKIDYTTAEPGAYPIVLVTYEFTCQTGLPSAKNPALVQAFLNYGASDAGQANLTATGYVPITGDLLTKVRAAITSIQTS